MKNILFIILFTSVINAQSFYDKLLTIYADETVYNGSELITNTIDRGFELGTERFVGTVTWTNEAGNPFETFTTSTNTITSAINSSGSGRCYSATTTLGSMTMGDYYKVIGNLTLNSGEAPRVKFRNQLSADISALTYLANGANSLTLLITSANSTGSHLYIYNSTNTNWALSGVSVRQMTYWTGAGNHSVDTSYIKQAGTYGLKITSSGAGNGSTNTISLASSLFTAVTSGVNCRFQVYAYSPTAGTTLTFKLGDIVLTKTVSNSGMGVLNFEFKATASTTGNIYLYANQTSSIILDEASLKGEL